MNTFIHFRDGIRKFVLQREMIFLRLWNVIVAFVGLMAVKDNFGYNKTISETWICLVLALTGILLPMRGVAFVICVFLVVNVVSLNLQVALVAAGMVIIGYLLCAYFHSKNTYNMAVVPILTSMGCPFVATLGTGLMSNINELCSLLCGTVTAFYLHVIKTNAASILDETVEVSVIGLLKEHMLQDKMFYFTLVAVTVMFLIVYLFRQATISMSWLIANVAGVVAEFTIMLAGYLLTNQKGEISSLIVGNIVVLAVGFILNYFVLDLDYSRIEKVQFEDDDYYYYVTAVPKIRIASEEKEIKTF